MKSGKLIIADVCQFIGGSQPPKSTFSYIKLPNYVRLVQTRDFKTDAFPTYIHENSTTKFFTKDDIMIGRYGPPIFQIFRGMEGAYNVALLKAKPLKNILNDYLYYFLKQKEVFEYVDKLSARTGGQTGVDLVSLYKYPIALPTIENQKKIIAVLLSLDNKIELNNKINTELEQMAKMLYDYWFVQFDFPDANGKPYKSSGGKMVYNFSLKREIPLGWESGQLGDVGKVSMCKRVMKHETSSHEEIPFFKISTFGGDANTYISRDLFELYREKYSYPKRGDILISAAGTIGKIVIFDGESSYFQDSNIVWIDNDESKIPNCFLFYYYQTEPWVATGGSTIKRLYNDNIRSLKTIFPNSEILKQFSKIINPRLEKKHQIESENKKIASLRDWLLPMLMNGQVTVGDAEEMVYEQLEMVAEGNVEYKKGEE
ncbi:hypothetical protein DBR27_19900 [Flavobacterium sp. HMWF030]|nr:hypothetical protein DBR27_19900 [Flavobacterium sp. HMWF030]